MIRAASTIGTMDSFIKVVVPSRVVERQSAATSAAPSSAASCAPGDNSGRCEKPVNSSAYTLPIVLAVVIPVVAAIILFIILHRRHLRKQREEDNDDRHASLDFGMGDVPQPGRAKKRPMPGMLETNFGEKSAHRHNQMSMDLGMTSPYLLPPELQSSRESLHSLSRTIHQNEDPYRPVTQYYPGDGASIRSQSRQGPDGASIYTSSSKAASKFQDGTEGLLANAARMSRSSPPVATAFIPPPRQNSLPQKNPSVNTVEVNAGDSTPQSPPPYPVEPPQAHIHESSIPGNGSPAGPLPDHGLAPALNTSMDGRASYASSGDAGLRQSNNYLGSIIEAQDPSAPDNTAERGAALTSERSPLPANPQPIRKQSLNILQSSHQSLSGEVDEIGDGFKVTPPSPGLEKDAEHTRGQRQSMSAAPEEFAHAGLNAPALDPRRLSMGLRPLPPDAVTEVDDPEVRANRIRSFYKEYFDESKPAPEGQYHEDYDENYLGDAAYFDPDSNNFVMPYAQPVTRRAMTPPPSGPRFQGARMPGPRFQGPPRAMHGSMGGMSSISGMRGPQGPRAFSSASGRMGPPRKPMPPPAALTTLPTPSKLRDDTLAIMNPLDFAPPQTFRDRVAGRSESPLGERRPYSPAVPSFVPVVSAFDELAPIPSPHLLRKSGTFTSLDFAPPKRIRDPDSMSDAGSIRSNRSGISAMHLGAIRSGAYRVSRLPQDMVFAKDDMAALKPQWGMRAGS